MKVNLQTTLDLGGNNIGDEGAQVLAVALQNTEIVTTLTLEKNNIGAEGAKELAEALKNNKTVTTLYLGVNNIEAEGAQVLAEALKNNKTVIALTLEKNNIGDKGAQALAEALKNNNTVTALNLEENNIGDEGVQALLEALKNNSAVTSLFLRGNNVGNEKLQEIKNLLKRNLKMNLVYSKESSDIGDIKMTLSFALDQSKNSSSDDTTFYENIRSILGCQPFCRLETNEIHQVLQDLFSDCDKKIEPFKKSVAVNGGVTTFSGDGIENAEEAIKNLPSSPSASPKTPQRRSVVQLCSIA
ncbi:MAG: Ran GTPase-activating protein (RanGAP) involved in mRNA processing and transport [Ulvibacter sp.]|jgi:Ran GTPase-activating protein (RanGAP) involved in mRNA processing and transport